MSRARSAESAVSLSGALTLDRDGHEQRRHAEEERDTHGVGVVRESVRNAESLESDGL